MVVCPQCGAAALQADPEGGLICQQCGASFRRAVATCPACGAENPPSAEECAACGTPLGIAAQVLAQRGGQASPIWLERTRAQAPGLKAAGEVSSRERFDDLASIDRRREQRWAADRAARAVEDRRMIRLLAAAAAVFAIVLVTALLVTLLR